MADKTIDELVEKLVLEAADEVAVYDSSTGFDKKALLSTVAEYVLAIYKNLVFKVDHANLQTIFNNAAAVALSGKQGAIFDGLENRGVTELATFPTIEGGYGAEQVVSSFPYVIPKGYYMVYLGATWNGNYSTSQRSTVGVLQASISSDGSFGGGLWTEIRKGAFVTASSTSKFVYSAPVYSDGVNVRLAAENGSYGGYGTMTCRLRRLGGTP